MRGCLFVILFAAAVLGVGAWFLAPTLAAAVIDGALQSSGFAADSKTLTVAADPPVRLLVGRADRIDLDAQGVRWRTLAATRLGLEVDDVDLFARTARTVHGRFDGVAVTDGEGTPSTSTAVATITFEGPAGAAITTVDVDGESVRALVTAAVLRAFGARLTGVQLVPPNGLRLVAPGMSIDGALVVDVGGHGIGLSNRLGTVPIVTVDPSLPLRIEAVQVDATTLTIRGVLDVQSLLGTSAPG